MSRYPAKKHNAAVCLPPGRATCSERILDMKFNEAANPEARVAYGRVVHVNPTKLPVTRVQGTEFPNRICSFTLSTVHGLSTTPNRGVLENKIGSLKRTPERRASRAWVGTDSVAGS